MVYTLCISWLPLTRTSGFNLMYGSSVQVMISKMSIFLITCTIQNFNLFLAGNRNPAGKKSSWESYFDRSKALIIDITYCFII